MGKEGLHPGGTGLVYWPAVADILLTSVSVAPLGAQLAHTPPPTLPERIFAVVVVVVAATLPMG